MKGFTLDTPPTFDDLSTVSGDVQDSIDNVVSCIKELTGDGGKEEPACVRSLSKSARESKNNKDVGLENGNDEAVSFILSIEPVRENVKEILNENISEIEKHGNPQAIFVMLPNFDLNELNDNEVVSGGDNDERKGRRLIDGFIVDDAVEEGVGNVDDGDTVINDQNKDPGPEDQESGSGGASVHLP